jgi:S-disulfanyl-L-cysteine oxidoreductase SoxD
MNQQFSKRSMLVLGVFTAVAAGQVAPAESEEPAATKASLTGQQVYKTVCIACHAPPGVGGAPALGNADAWAGRITQGMETLSDHALNGFSGNTGVMPKKGERPDLSDEEIIKAVKYMVEQAAQ